MSSSKESKPGVLTESEALELFAWLLAAARTQLDDPAVYGSMRLLTAAENLRDIIRGRVSPNSKQMFDETKPLTTKAQINILDEDTYQATLDELNRLVANFLVAQSSLGGSDNE